jgi:hypothetical protein
MWGTDYPLIPSSTSKRALLDRGALTARWKETREFYTQMLKPYGIEVMPHLSHPQLDGFEKYVKLSWGTLDTDTTFQMVLGFVERMEDSPIASRIGLAELSDALDLYGSAPRVAEVTLETSQYIARTPFWRDFQRGLFHATRVHESNDFVPGKTDRVYSWEENTFPTPSIG